MGGEGGSRNSGGFILVARGRAAGGLGGGGRLTGLVGADRAIKIGLAVGLRLAMPRSRISIGWAHMAAGIAVVVTRLK